MPVDIKKVTLILLCSMLLNGCALPLLNGGGNVSKYYKGYSPEEIASEPGVLPCDDFKVTYLKGEILDPDYAKDDVLELIEFERGYFPVGESSFEGSSNHISKADVIAWTRKLGACHAYWGPSSYAGTRTYQESYKKTEPIGAYIRMVMSSLFLMIRPIIEM